MKLYHFTQTERTESILQNGLRANPIRFSNVGEKMKFRRGVFLTELEHTRLTPEQSLAHFRFNGERHNYWLIDHVREPIARVTVNIGDKDARLIWPGECLVPHFADIISRWWIYLGAIPPDRITAVDLEERSA